MYAMTVTITSQTDADIAAARLEFTCPGATICRT